MYETELIVVEKYKQYLMLSKTFNNKTKTFNAHKGNRTRFSFAHVVYHTLVFIQSKVSSSCISCGCVTISGKAKHVF